MGMEIIILHTTNILIFSGNYCSITHFDDNLVVLNETEVAGIQTD